MRHEIVDEKDEVIAEVQDVIVLYNFEINTKVSIPEDIRRRIIE